MRTVPVLLVALVALAALAAAQPNPQQVANETVEMGMDTVDGVVGGVEGQVPRVAPPAVDDGGGLAGAADAVGRFFQAVASGVAAAATAVGGAFATGGTWAASALANGLSALGSGAVAAAGSIGAGAGLLVAAVASALSGAGAWVAARVGSLAALYAGFVGRFRPTGMDPATFTAIAATGAAGTAGVAGYGLWGLLRRYAWLLGGLAGFSRIEDSDLLRHPLRSQVFQVIQNNPGIHASELSRKVGAGWGTIVHHLDKLEKGRLVTVRRVNNQKCYFEDGGKVSRQDMAIAGAVRGDSASLITAYVTSHPMTSQKAMAQELGISPALVSFHVKKLAGAGVLDKVRRGKETLLTTTQAVRRVFPASSPAAPPMVAATG